MNKTKTVLSIFIFLLIGATATGIFLTRKIEAPTPTARPAPTLKPTPAPKTTTPIKAPTPTPAEIKVYITGAVKNPGVYKMQPGDRIENALKTAGGPTTDADLLNLDLAQRVTDEMHITVPTKKK